ncbi:MAG TPA: acyl carrier protein [Terriglobia bacterium]|jgi:acyl carrier protein|nr:acyl carrier protein [Terriglobia bacterium]
MEKIEHRLRKFVIDNFLFGEPNGSLSDDDSFVEKGIIDSTGILELVAFLEKHFQIRVEDEELTPDNLDSVNKVAAYIRRKAGLAQG